MSVADVTIIGGGAAGVLVAAHIARLATEPIRVAIIEPGPGRLGSGVAYATVDPGHLLNVRTANLSAWDDEPDHFVTWLAGRGTPARPNDYVARSAYGAYLATVAADAKNGTVTHVREIRARAVDARREYRGWTLLLSDGTTLSSRDIVLATGIGAPAPILDPGSRARYIADPWRPGALESIGDGERVLVVGTGLTAIDVATTLARGDHEIVAVSRHGLLPAAHTIHARTPMPYEPVQRGLAALRRHMRAWITASVATTGDWRPAVDGVRPHVQRIWQSFDDRDKYAFLGRDRRRWEIARHRMAPQVAAAVAAMRATGQLTVVADHAASAIAVASPETWIINATGPDNDLRRTEDALLRALLHAGHIASGPCRIGISTTGHGQVLDAAGRPVPGLWTLGSPRRGDLWESTAIPEIRAQARYLAETLLPAPVPVPTRG